MQRQRDTIIEGWKEGEMEGLRETMMWGHRDGRKRDTGVEGHIEGGGD